MPYINLKVAGKLTREQKTAIAKEFSETLERIARILFYRNFQIPISTVKTCRTCRRCIEIQLHGKYAVRHRDACNGHRIRRALRRPCPDSCRVVQLELHIISAVC